MKRKPKIAIVGAGMAGLSAANRLMEVIRGKNGPSPFDVIVLEASDRVGGRICSTEFHGENVESGATWIHGIEGSPIYEIADQIGAMKDNGGKPWEFMDGIPHDIPVVAQGGFIVPSSVAYPMLKWYRELLSVVQKQFKNNEFSLEETQRHRLEELAKGSRSLGEYLRKGLDKYFEVSGQCPSDVMGKISEFSTGEPSFGTPIEDFGTPKRGFGTPIEDFGTAKRDFGTPKRDFGMPNWDLRSLQEGVFWSQGNLERSIIAADDLDDVDLESHKEYTEFPGLHMSIPRGFSSVVHELLNRLPQGSILYNARVEGIEWRCKEIEGRSRAVWLKGPDIEADHVILTVSLGVLKSCVKNCKKNDADGGNDGVIEGLGFHGFQPQLPSRKVGAISRLGFGVVDKVHLHFGSAAPEMSGITFVFGKEQDMIPWWMKKTFALVPTHKNSRILAAWLVGKEAVQMESLSNEEVIQGVIHTFSAFGINSEQKSEIEDSHGALVEEKNRPFTDDLLRSKWGTNPLYWGSYSYVPLGSSQDDIEILAEPLPCSEDQSIKPLQLLFAGEATDKHYYSTTHAAYLSGVKEANRLLKHYNLL